MLGPKLQAASASDTNIDSGIHMALNRFGGTSSHSHVAISDGAVSARFFVVNSSPSSSMYRLTYTTFPAIHQICVAPHYEAESLPCLLVPTLTSFTEF